MTDTLLQFDFEAPGPHGFADRPTMLRSIEYVYPGFTRITFHDIEDVLLVGDAGMQRHENAEAEHRGGQPAGATTADGWPGDGWKLASVRSDQTGGMTMVDVLQFENGWCLTLTNECAVMWDSVKAWDGSREGYEDNAEQAFLWY